MKKCGKRILSVLLWIVIIAFLLFAAATLAVTITYRVRGEDAELFGRQYRIVTSGSMEPAIMTGELVCF